MISIWIIVADSSRARIFSAGKDQTSMLEIQTLAHPAARLHEGDLVSDKAGREWNRGTISHDMNGESSAKHGEVIRFANQICQALESGHNNGKFNKLYVIAAPGFLGALRKQLPRSIQKLIAAEVSKNLVTHDISDMRKHLPESL